MPEGPETRRAADAVADVIAGRRIEAVSFGQPHLRAMEDVLAGNRVTAVETRGKAFLTHFEHGYTIYSHNQLYGVWRTSARGTLPQGKRTLRLALHTRDESALLYSASDISVWRTDELDRHPFLKKLGPDILDPALDWRVVSARLRDRVRCGRSVGALYLDQSFLAGLGNYLRSEILHDAGAYPWAKPAQLTRKAINQLARSTLRLSQRSYETGGITNVPGRVKRLQSSGVSRNGYRFAVFDRAAEPCYRCGLPVERVTFGSRRLYWCPRCQAPEPVS